MPASWILLARVFSGLNLLPHAPPNGMLLLHPITWTGWAGMVVTMLNLLPVAMLDGGHVARSTLTGDKPRQILTFASVALLLFIGTEFLIMAFVIILTMVKHPGPLDDVSNLSRSRKLLTVALVVVFILAFPVRV
jgi:membrane-associated protease RseP (regulator of RpoE activity)